MYLCKRYDYCSCTCLCRSTLCAASDQNSPEIASPAVAKDQTWAVPFTRMNGSAVSSQSIPAALRFPLICPNSSAQVILFWPNWKDIKDVARSRILTFSVSFLNLDVFRCFVSRPKSNPAEVTRYLVRKVRKTSGCFFGSRPILLAWDMRNWNAFCQTDPKELKVSDFRFQTDPTGLKVNLVHVAYSDRGKVNLVKRPGGVIDGDKRFLLRKCEI